MKFKRQLYEKILESCKAVLPICFIVIVLAMTVTPLTTDIFSLFVIGSIMLVVGMGLFTLGAEMSMTIMGEEIGIKLSESKNILLTLLVCFVLGFVVTIAEPDLSVLASQIQSIPNLVLILVVGIGVGLFLVVGQIRNMKYLKLRNLLLVFYSVVFLLALSVDRNFVAVAFDASGVTTGPITVPFIMALGIGLARSRDDENASNDAFGLISLCSIGPILAVLILSLFYKPTDAYTTSTTILEIHNMYDVGQAFLTSLPVYFHEVFVAFLPIVAICFLFQIFTRTFSKHSLIKIAIGLIYTFFGLVLFLTAANVGFMSTGSLIGEYLALRNPYLLVLFGAIIGYFIVKAEPAVILLTHQVEEISNGSISAKAIEHALSIGIAFSIACAMFRMIRHISILYFLIPGYAISILLSFVVPSIYTGIAFDSGGVASGPMTATFLLPLATGACNSLGGNILTEAFGIVAMVAMTPLITIQILGLINTMQVYKTNKLALNKLCEDNLDVIYFEEEAYE